jgi:hypothetical protein
MQKTEFIKAVRKLALNPDEYVVIGSGILAVLDIRSVSDVDLVVSKSVFQQFELSGNWKRKDLDDGTYYLLNGIYEIGLDWDSKDITPNLKDLKNSELIFDDIPFISLERLSSWKKWKGTPKHLADIKLIDDYLNKQT